MVLWLVIYWLAVLPFPLVIVTAFILLFAQYSADEAVGPFFSGIGLLAGAIATIIGAICASALAGSGVRGSTFMRGTTAIRTNAVAWLGIQLGLLLWALFGVKWTGPVESNPGVQFGNLLDWTVTNSADTIAAVLGFGSVLLFVGNGIAELAVAREGAPKTSEVTGSTAE
jgi:hypothetical protein